MLFRSDSVTPATWVLTKAKKSAAVRSRSKRARPSSEIEEHSSSAHDSPATSPIRDPEPKAKFSLTKAFHKMNRFFMDRQHKGYKEYKAGKVARRNQRAIMTALKLTPEGPPSSEELDEDKWMSKNTLWLGDDMTSLGQFRPSYLDEASTSQVSPTHMHVDQGIEVDQGVDDDPSDDDDQDGHDDEDGSQDGQDDEDFME